MGAEEGLPKTFEALRTNKVKDGLSFPPASSASSWTPPNTAERTLPPEALHDAARASGSGMAWMSGALAAVIVLAVGVGVRQWTGGGEPAAAASGSGADDLSPAAQVSAPATLVQESDTTTLEAVGSAREQENHAEPPPGSKRDVTASDEALGASKGTSPNAPGEPVVDEASGRTGSALAKRPSKTSRSAQPLAPSATLAPAGPAKEIVRVREKTASGKPRQAPRSAIPDNPY